MPERLSRPAVALIFAALSVALILFVVLAIYMGLIEPYGVGRNPG